MNSSLSLSGAGVMLVAIATLVMVVSGVDFNHKWRCRTRATLIIWYTAQIVGSLIALVVGFILFLAGVATKA